MLLLPVVEGELILLLRLLISLGDLDVLDIFGAVMLSVGFKLYSAVNRGLSEAAGVDFH